MAALVQQSPAAFDAGLRQPYAVRANLACGSGQASQFIISVMGYAIQGQGQDDRTNAIYLTDARRSLLGAVLVAMGEPPQGSEDGPADASPSSSLLFSRQPIRTYAPKLLQL